MVVRWDSSITTMPTVTVWRSGFSTLMVTSRIVTHCFTPTNHWVNGWNKGSTTKPHLRSNLSSVENWESNTVPYRLTMWAFQTVVYAQMLNEQLDQNVSFSFLLPLNSIILFLFQKRFPLGSHCGDHCCDGCVGCWAVCFFQTTINLNLLEYSTLKLYF